MNLALEEARLAYKKNEIPVGCVIVKGDAEVIGRGHNLAIQAGNPINHAEIIAAQNALENLNHGTDGIISSFQDHDISAYVTLEPCTMCLSYLSMLRIKKIFYGLADHKFGGINRIFDAQSALFRPEIFYIEQLESRDLLERFFRNLRQGK